MTCARYIILDATPLGPASRRRGIPVVDACYAWLNAHFDFDIKDLVKVKKLDGGFESREVAPGDLDETVTLIEIKQGLKPGEQVAEKPLELLSEEEKSKREQGRLARPAAAKPAPRKPALPQ